MIRVYLLPVQILGGEEYVSEEDLIHHALLEVTEDPDVRKLTMDTTPDEDALLSASAIESRDATYAEIDRYHAQVIPYVPDPDTIRAEELLATSPGVITMPEMWELVRIFGRRLGYRF